MATLTTINLASFVTRSEDGSIDHDATCEAFRTNLIAYAAEREVESEMVAEAVKAVFDANPGASINSPALAHLAMKRLDVLRENYEVISERLAQYVHENAGSPTSGALFGILRGKGGGVVRWSDQSADRIKKFAELAEKAAAKKATTSA